MEEKISSSLSIQLLCLTGASPIEALVSDHNPVINHGVLSFNIMMQCRWSPGRDGRPGRYNNGFGIIEDQKQYQQRLKAVVAVIAELSARHPQLYAIGLEEAPINPEDIAVFMNEFNRYPSLAKFKESLETAIFSSWGIVTLFDTEHFFAEQLDLELTIPHLKDRIQKFRLHAKKEPMDEFEVYNCHLPFDLAKSHPESLFGFLESLFSGALPAVLMGDFNIDPKTLKKLLSYVKMCSPENNNVLAICDHSGKVIGQELDTVDGILSSDAERIPVCTVTAFHFFSSLVKGEALLNKMTREIETERLLLLPFKSHRKLALHAAPSLGSLAHFG
jgi:hypothetical protein